LPLEHSLWSASNRCHRALASAGELIKLNLDCRNLPGPPARARARANGSIRS
jgi:hypothetical protein